MRILPPRSQLYYLVPQALETLWCESLTGYINRLGWTHHVSPRSLVAEVINQELPSPTPFVAVFCLQAAMGLNGNGEQAGIWAGVVGQLTAQADLHRLTLASLLGDFPPMRLLRRTPAWCPACLAEWKTSGKILYQPLLWMLQVVTMCPHHRVPLVDRCSHCHRHQKALTTNKTKPFECTSCKRWLGGEVKPLAEEGNTAQLISWQIWVISALEEIHTASLQGGLLSWKSFFTQLSSYLKERRAYSRVAQAIGTGKENFHRWVNDQDPTLETLLKFCYRCEITPWQVMNGKLDPLERVLREGAYRAAPLPPRRQQRLDHERCLRHLHAALAESEAPPSLRQVGRQLGYGSTRQLTYHFPEECALIIQRHAQYREQRKEQRLLKLREDIRQAVFSLYAQGEYPLRYKLSTIFPNGVMRQREATEAWRAALAELGLEP
jgi:hypothetical protein